MKENITYQDVKVGDRIKLIAKNKIFTETHGIITGLKYTFEGEVVLIDHESGKSIPYEPLMIRKKVEGGYNKYILCPETHNYFDIERL